MRDHLRYAILQCNRYVSLFELMLLVRAQIAGDTTASGACSGSA